MPTAYITAVCALAFPFVAACSSASDSGAAGAGATSSSVGASDAGMASATTSRNDNIDTSAFDMGTIDVGGFTVPVRGQLVMPKKAAVGAKDNSVPLVVINHLRAPNCSNQSFAYPCPADTKDVRYDEGMVYLGESLAEQGFAAVIPDLGAQWSGEDTKQPHDQQELWKATVTKIKDELLTATGSDSGKPRIDVTRVGLMTHSRASQALEPAVELFGHDSVKGVFAYAPAYDTFDQEHFSPAAPDVPYLAVDSDMDADVSLSANLWASEHVFTQRTKPLLVASVSGLGHFYANRTLSAAGNDDRTSCDLVDCPDAAAHERAISDIAGQWFGATLGGETSDLPGDASPLPDTIAGLDARWLAASPGNAVHLQPADFHAAVAAGIAGAADAASAAGAGSSVQVCRHADPMDPSQNVDSACPEPDSGIGLTSSELAHIRGTATAQLPTDVQRPNDQAPTMLAVHLLPFGSGTDATTVTIAVTLDDGRTIDLPIDPNSPALRDRYTKYDNGQYIVSTVRIPLPDDVSSHSISSISVHTGDRPIELRGIDVVY